MAHLWQVCGFSGPVFFGTILPETGHISWIFPWNVAKSWQFPAWNSQQSMDLAGVARRARPSITSPRLPPSYAATACWTSPFRRSPRWNHVPMGLWMDVFPWVFPWVSVKNGGENSEFWLAERVNVDRFRAMFDYQSLVGIDRVLRNPSKQVSVLIWKHGNQKNCPGYFTRIVQDPGGLICLVCEHLEMPMKHPETCAEIVVWWVYGLLNWSFYGFMLFGCLYIIVICM